MLPGSAWCRGHGGAGLGRIGLGSCWRCRSTRSGWPGAGLSAAEAPFPLPYGPLPWRGPAKPLGVNPPQIDFLESRRDGGATFVKLRITSPRREQVITLNTDRPVQNTIITGDGEPPRQRRRAIPTTWYAAVAVRPAFLRPSSGCWSGQFRALALRTAACRVNRWSGSAVSYGWRVRRPQPTRRRHPTPLPTTAARLVVLYCPPRPISPPSAAIPTALMAGEFAGRRQFRPVPLRAPAVTGLWMA